jgi:DNA-directed RNA polymerase subunit M/transcription elongation factor TFIIS
MTLDKYLTIAECLPKEQEPQAMYWQKHTDASGNPWHTCPACGHIAYTLTRFCPDCGACLEAPS